MTSRKGCERCLGSSLEDLKEKMSFSARFSIEFLQEISVESPESCVFICDRPLGSTTSYPLMAMIASFVIREMKWCGQRILVRKSHPLTFYNSGTSVLFASVRFFLGFCENFCKG